ncbi:General transcription factor II-I repeat domain-containing protein 2 [Takifugu flavidus]|uniref:General transcription factor II-I repeat domain-containing protein 2 n=1 Tax=Takifugu flavidus TaxID=433684 RepID=A0A5C6N0K8_9TELE|nr:General transcription factor II-I repeat domain-containing protein 2 [Takifugu flavidus]
MQAHHSVNQKYVDVILKLQEEFEHRFADFKMHRARFQIFADPFSFDVQDAPPVLQMELIDLQCNSELKAKFREVSGKADKLGQFLRELTPSFPELSRMFKRTVCLFGSTYLCEKLFSTLNFNKSKYRSRLTNEHLQALLRVSTASSLKPNVARLSVRDAVKLKKESYRALLACGTPADRYRQAKRSAATAVAEAKTRAWEEFGEAMENDFQTASKRFWTTIRHLRKGKQCTVNTVYNADGVLLTSTWDFVDRWKEYFEDLLNPTNTLSSPGVDEIRPEFLKALDVVGLSWLTRLCNIAWTSGAVPLDWQTGVVVPLFKKGDRRVCSNYRGITLLSLPGKVYSGVLERRVRRIVEPRIQEEQCGFRPERGTVDQLYTISRVLEGAWEFAQPVHMCFVDLEKPFDRVPRGVLWGALREYGVSGPLIRAVCSLYDRCQSLVHIAGRSGLLFADDVVLLAPSARDLQRSLDRFAIACEAAGMKISTSKSEAMVLNRKKVECLLQVKEELVLQVEEFKYLGVLFTSEGRMEQEVDRRIGAASAVMQSLHRSVVVKKFTGRSSFLPSPMVMSFGDRVRSSAIREELGVEPLLLCVERSQMRWLGHLVRMPPGRLPGEETPGKTQDILCLQRPPGKLSLRRGEERRGEERRGERGEERRGEERKP